MKFLDFSQNYAYNNLQKYYYSYIMVTTIRLEFVVVNTYTLNDHTVTF